MPSGVSPGGRPIDESPLSSSTDDNWVAKAGGLPPYIRGVARGIAKKHGGAVTSKDIAEAIGRMKVWAAGGGGVTAPVQAAAAAAIAEWESKKAAAHSLSHTEDDLLLSWATFDANRPKGQGTVAGYTGPALDPATIAKIQAFQQANGLPVTGNLDHATVAFAAANMSKIGAGGKGKGAKGAANKAAAAQKKAAALQAKQQKQVAAYLKKLQSQKVSAAKKTAAAAKKATAAKASAAKKAAATALQTKLAGKVQLQKAVKGLNKQAAAADKAGNHRGAEAIRVEIAQLNARIAAVK